MAWWKFGGWISGVSMEVGLVSFGKKGRAKFVKRCGRIYAHVLDMVD